jgi:hypothetical protein
MINLIAMWTCREDDRVNPGRSAANDTGTETHDWQYRPRGADRDEVEIAGHKRGRHIAGLVPFWGLPIQAEAAAAQRIIARFL